MPFFYAAETNKIVITQGNFLEITCRLLYGFEKNQSPVFNWLLNGKVFSRNYTGQYKIKTNIQAKLNKFQSTIRIESINPKNSGNYECQANNIYGNSSQVVLVKVKPQLAPLW